MLCLRGFVILRMAYGYTKTLILIFSLEKQLEVDGELLCTDIFRTLFTIDEEVNVGDTRSIELYKSYRTPES